MTKLLNKFQQKHPRFYYRNYTVTNNKNIIKFRFNFEIEPNIFFSPEVEICGIDSIDKNVLNNLAFHLGLMEIPSYWKSTCSPEIYIQAGELDDYQIVWWKNLFLKGLMEFFYLNKIKPFSPEFICSGNGNVNICKPYDGKLNEDFLVPVGGGKDSAVSCELLRKTGRRVTGWCLNPTKSILDQIETSEIKTKIVVTRTIDNTLLQLNDKGYLNGHTPFSAYLAFASSACAIIAGKSNIALSNERSSNECNVKYSGLEVNHQYSKSFDFEKLFRDYSTRYLATNLNYFSLLRPLYEIQIARLFAMYHNHFPLFRSCNKGQRTNSWCHKCPKCLFVFTILYPFVNKKTLTTDIFATNLFEDIELVETAFSLSGLKEAKPFECVGTKEETIAAFYLCIKQVNEKREELPIVLNAVNENVLYKEQDLDNRTVNLLQSWNDDHFVPESIKIESKIKYIK